MATDFDNLYLVRDDSSNFAGFSPAKGKNYTYTARFARWESRAPFQPAKPDGLVTCTYLNGITYVFYESDRCQTYDFGSDLWVEQTMILPVDVSVENILGICSAGNYMLAFSATEIFWSTQTNVLDFADTDHGAGRGSPQGLQGRIITVLPVSSGAIIHTTKNAVSAQLTNQASLPFVFPEVRGSTGVGTARQVVADSATGYHYLFGPGGLHRLSAAGSEAIFAAATDFLSGKAYDTYVPPADLVTPAVQMVLTTKPLDVALTVLAGRYLAASYGPDDGTPYVGAVLFDLALMRWGRVSLLHRAIGHMPPGEIIARYKDKFTTSYTSELAGGSTYNSYLPSGAPEAPHRENIIFLQADGTCKKLALGGTDGILLLGRVQLTRGTGITFQEMLVEGGPDVDVLLIGSHSGAGREVSYLPSKAVTGNNHSEWAGRFSCTNFDVSLKGSFDLVQVALSVTSFPQRNAM